MSPKAAGFDYIELSTSEIVALSDSDFDKLVGKLKELKLPVPVTYLFIPARIKLTGPEIDKEEQMRYVKKLLIAYRDWASGGCVWQWPSSTSSRGVLKERGVATTG